MTDSTQGAYTDADVQEAFPVVDPCFKPFGGRVLVQMRLPKKKLASGIILPEDSRDTERAQTPIGVIRAVGPLAFKNRDTLEDWEEGVWANVGDFVRVPRWTGDRFEIRIDEDTNVEFYIMNDHELIGAVTGNPLEVKAYV
jgi:co-chaperonin GroES (HSP10)